MTEPAFRVLDEVQNRAAERGVVVEVRRSPDGSFRYALGSLEEDGAFGLHDEADLTATGTRADADDFQLPGPFLVRDVVRVAGDCDPPEPAGYIAVIDGTLRDDGDELELGIWVPELQEGFLVEARYLSATGHRDGPPQLPRTVGSTRVSEDGEVLGHSTYTITDEIERYL